MAAAPALSGSRVLIVEGSDELHVVSRLREVCELNVSFDIEVRGRIESLLKAAYSDATSSGRERVGFLIDANSDPNSR